jgi:FeS assembly protein IscX
MKPDDTIHWLDVDLIAEALAQRFPDKDPLRIGFVELKRLVESLPNFREQPGHPANERILEEIQQCWIEERSGVNRDDEGDEE